MPTDLQRRKLEKVFASFDMDQDGVLHEGDLTSMARIWCETYGVAPQSQEWVKIHEHAHNLWSDMRATLDTEDTHQVAVADWVAWVDEPDFAEFVVRTAVPFSMAVFDVADDDQDGKINVAEMMAAQSKSGMSESETRTVFHKLDTDQDGYVTNAEYFAAAKDFYLSDDPEAPGNLIAGRL